MKKIPIHYYKNIKDETIDISNNELEEISSYAFEECTKLEEIKCNGNTINKITN